MDRGELQLDEVHGVRQLRMQWLESVLPIWKVKHSIA